jgi:hypothetical protein
MNTPSGGGGGDAGIGVVVSGPYLLMAVVMSPGYGHARPPEPMSA